MSEDDGGLALQGFVVTALEAFAGFRGRQQVLDLIDERGGVGVSGRRIRFGGLIDADDRAPTASGARRTMDRR